MKNILVEQSGPVKTVIINRPKRRNAINEETAGELLEAFEAFEQDEESSVAVLAGADGCFCSGWDLKEFETENFAERYDPKGDGALRVARRLLNKPVIGMHCNPDLKSFFKKKKQQRMLSFSLIVFAGTCR